MQTWKHKHKPLTLLQKQKSEKFLARSVKKYKLVNMRCSCHTSQRKTRRWLWFICMTQYFAGGWVGATWWNLRETTLIGQTYWRVAVDKIARLYRIQIGGTWGGHKVWVEQTAWNLNQIYPFNFIWINRCSHCSTKNKPFISPIIHYIITLSAIVSAIQWLNH